MKVAVPPAVIDFYTDILAHCFDPNGADERVAAGTTMGKVMVIERDWEKNEAFANMERKLPNSAPVLGLYWSRVGILVGAKSLLHLYQNLEDEESLPVRFEVAYDVQDVCSNAAGSVVFGACDDCKVRAWDAETQKLVIEFVDHKMPVDVCKTNSEYLVSGSQDGQVMVYDVSLRSQQPVASFNHEKAAISGLDISNNSSWIAAGSYSAPRLHNLKNLATLPPIPMKYPQKIYTTHFDQSGNLWWGGGAGRIYKSLDLTSLGSEIKAVYGEATIHHIYSITTASPKRLSVAGASTGILFSENSEFWDGMIHI